MSNAIRAVPLAALMLFGALGSAWADGWVAAKVTQPAHFNSDGRTWTPLRDGLEVPDSAWVQTGARGMVMLRRNAESIIIKPDSLAAIVSRDGASPKTDVVQKFGALVLDIEKRNTRHTTVHTPFLAAIVKGTRFEVVVGDAGAEVRVENGVVETTDLRRGERVDVRAGQSVGVAASGGGTLEVKGAGPKAAVTRVKPSTPVVTSRGQTNATDRQAKAAGARTTAVRSQGARRGEGAAGFNGSSDTGDGGAYRRAYGPDARRTAKEAARSVPELKKAAKKDSESGSGKSDKKTKKVAKKDKKDKKDKNNKKDKKGKKGEK